MAIWILEPGHTEAEFRARHMMVTWVRGLFKNIRGTVEWDRETCERTTFEGRFTERTGDTHFKAVPHVRDELLDAFRGWKSR